MKGTQQASKGLPPTPDVQDTVAAARWFHRFLDTDVSSLSPEELADWAAWSEENTRLEKVRTLDRIWGSLGTAAKESGPRPTDSAVAADEYHGEDQRIPEWIAEGSRKRKRWRPGRLTTFLATAACLMAALLAFVKYDRLEVVQQLIAGDQVQSFATAPSEHRTIDLSDGSRITIGARTELTVHYTAKRRFVFLDHGEASFSVAHNSLRPFQVFAGGGSITALGTQFDVRREVDPADNIEHVVVTVSSGSVEVGPPGETVEAASNGAPQSGNAEGLSARKKRNPPEWAPARLVKGQELTYSTDGPQGDIESVNLQEVSAWKEGRLEYRHTPFRDVIPRVNRYSVKRIVLADDGVGDLTYSGTVFEGQVEDWLHALQTIYPIEVTQTDDHFVLHYDRARDASTE
jgi:transmembrane sensor